MLRVIRKFDWISLIRLAKYKLIKRGENGNDQFIRWGGNLILQVVLKIRYW